MYVNSGITNIHNLATHPWTIWLILHDEGRYYNQFGAIMLWVAGEANNVIKSYEEDYLESYYLSQSKFRVRSRAH